MSLKLSTKIKGMAPSEQLSLLLLIPANILFGVAVCTYSWFELPGVAWYGLWHAKFCDLVGECHYVPAFFTEEPVYYHIVQFVCLVAWAGLGLSLCMLISNKLDYRIVPRFLKKKRHNAIAIICFISVFAMSGGLYLFYSIINEFPRDNDIYPELNWAAKCVSLACGFEFLAGLLLLQV